MGTRAIPALVGVNVLIYLALVLSPELSNLLLLSQNLDVVQDQPWTIITVFFAHELHIHLLLNLSIILVFGTLLEDETGPILVLTTYFLAGIAGSIGIIAVEPFTSEELIPGASAAALGLHAAIGVMRPNVVVGDGQLKYWVLVAILLNFVGIIAEVLGYVEFGIIGGIGLVTLGDRSTDSRLRRRLSYCILTLQNATVGTSATRV